MKCRFAVVAAALAVLGLPCLSRAQSATFTFGGQPNPLTSTSLQTEHCSEMTSWNGIPALNPDGTPNIDNPFPYNMGDICLQIYPSAYTDIDVPWQLGFPNNGFLQQCAPTVWGPLVFDGSGAQNIAGSTATQTFTCGCLAAILPLHLQDILCQSGYWWERFGGERTNALTSHSARLRVGGLRS